jgi:hypothetical protein
MYEDEHLEMAYEDSFGYDPYGYDYADESDNEDYLDMSDETDNFTVPDESDTSYSSYDLDELVNSDEMIGIATFGTSDTEACESDYYRRALQTAQFGWMI